MVENMSCLQVPLAALTLDKVGANGEVTDVTQQLVEELRKVRQAWVEKVEMRYLYWLSVYFSVHAHNFVFPFFLKSFDHIIFFYLLLCLLHDSITHQSCV